MNFKRRLGICSIMFLKCSQHSVLGKKINVTQDNLTVCECQHIGIYIIFVLKALLVTLLLQLQFCMIFL